MTTNGYIIYQGPSRLDGAPIVVIATGFANASSNSKAGAMIQTWILRADISPLDAVRTGDDSSICGACPHRGHVYEGRNVARSCYVNVFQAPRSVWASFRRDIYPQATDLTACFADRAVRLGTYGDPAAVPLAIWEAVTARASDHTGYTHQWRAFPELALSSLSSHSIAWPALIAWLTSLRRSC